MQQKSFWKEIWELLSPLVLRAVVMIVVETIVISTYYTQHIADFGNLQTEEQVAEMMAQVITDVYQYATELSALSAVATIPFFAVMMNRDKKKEKEAGILPNKMAPLKKYILVAGISIPFALGLNNILLLSNLAEYSVAYQETAESIYSTSFPVQIICVGVIIPVMEEFMFRGLIFKRMRTTGSATRAIILSAIIFGLYHGNAVQFVYATLCGVLLAYLYEKYGSLKAPILAHILMNVVACVLTEADIFTWMFSDTMRAAVITVVCAALASAMFVMIRQIDEKPEIAQNSEKNA